MREAGVGQARKSVGPARAIPWPPGRHVPRRSATSVACDRSGTADSSVTSEGDPMPANRTDAILPLPPARPARRPMLTGARGGALAVVVLAAALTGCGAAGSDPRSDQRSRDRQRVRVDGRSG